MKIFTFFLLCFLFVGAFLQTFAQSSDDMMNMVQDVCWSPDGNSLYFSAMRVKKDYSDFKPDKWGVYRYDLKTKTMVKIVESAFGVTVSPNGRQLAVGKVVEGKRDIYVMDADGKNAKQITTDQEDDFAPSWSPDGKQIAFNNKTDGKPEVYVINIDGSGLKRLTFSNGFRSYNPSWSPDGKQIAYYLEKGDGKDQVFVIKVDGSEPKNLTADDEFNNIYPGWADKNKVVYGQGKKGVPAKIFTVKTDGTQKQQLLTLESFYTRFSPDGKKIAYLDQKDRSIMIVSAKGEAIDKIIPAL